MSRQTSTNPVKSQVERLRAARAKRPGRLSAVLAAGLVLAATAACAPIQTDKPYEPSDGIAVTLGNGARGINLLVVSNGANMPGRLMGALTNETTKPVVFRVEPKTGNTLSIPVRAGETKYLTADDKQIFDSVTEPPGALLPVRISAGSDRATAVSLPILDGSIPEYSTAVPTATPTQTLPAPATSSAEASS